MQFFEVVVFCQTAFQEVCIYLNPIDITKELAFFSPADEPWTFERFFKGSCR